MPTLCKLLITFTLIVFLNSFNFAQALPELEKVKEIKLLEDSRDDVQRILASYQLQTLDNRIYVDTFNSDKVEIEVHYSEGKCDDSKEESDDWNVAELVITIIEITPQKTIKLNELGLNLSKFKRENRYININKVPKLHYHKDLGIIVSSNQGDVEKIIFLPPQKDLMKMCDKKFAKKLISKSSWLILPLKERIYTHGFHHPISDVVSLELSLTEVNSDCSSKDINNCFVIVKTKTSDSENSLLTFRYKTSEGKIIGSGANVKWDLSDVKPGTYTITAAVDDGCGFCGKTITKTVTVKECLDCKKP